MEGTAAGKHCYLLRVLSHKGNWETVTFRNILLQLWGVISGLLQCSCSIRHKSLKLFPIYDSSLFPLISGLTFFNLQHLYPLETPNSYLNVCPAQGQALLPLPQVAMDTRTCLGITFSKGSPALGCSISVIPSPTQGDFQSWELKHKFGLSSGQKGPWHSCKIRKLCSKKALVTQAQNIPMGSYCQWQMHVTFLMRKTTFTHPWSCDSCGFIFHLD